MSETPSHRILDALTAEIRENTGGEGFVTAYIVIAAFTDAEGDSNLYTESGENQRCHESLGLLAFGMAHENARALTGEDG